MMLIWTPAAHHTLSVHIRTCTHGAQYTKCVHFNVKMCRIITLTCHMISDIAWWPQLNKQDPKKNWIIDSQWLRTTYSMEKFWSGTSGAPHNHW